MFEYELETGFDRESECEFANEYESEQFFPLLAPLLAKAAPMAIQAIGGLIGRASRRRQREFEFEYEGEEEYEGDPFINNLLKSSNNGLGEGEGEYEYEYEFELATSSMSEYEMVMENLAYRAAHSESEAEAEAFLGALIPLATRLIPQAAQVLTTVAPSLIQGVSRMGQTWYRSPRTRPLLQTVPQIVKRTVTTIANQAQQGKPVSPKTAVRTLAGNTARVLNNPKNVALVMKNSHKAQHRVAKTNGNGKRRP
ncbi:hypothetical protein CLI64_07500 [Nostoc sp. CENA543]|uniref:hypothetical protein n=1 Tax=Nostoc sp. CENA543 TaxID=1869241 RepID=UPI000CA1B82E|nr:hypothetical protein [Nostoc sp. CENA543]AUT00239.1 hypothetical protein CLI64_07500 [Nostoc sp. CENA543]